MKANNLELKYYQKLFILLIPFITFGFYKNGILPFLKHTGDVYNIFNPLILIAISIFGCIVGNSIINKKITINYVYILDACLLGIILPLNTNIYILFTIALILGLIPNNFKINKVALSYLVIFTLNSFIQTSSWLNTYETTGIASYNFLDKFVGFNAGGSSSTSILLIMISLIIMCYDIVYKKEIGISSIITYVILIFVYGLINNNILLYKEMIFIPNVIFAFVFIAPALNSTCYTFKGKITMGILVGLFTFILNIFISNYSIFIVISVLSLIKNIIDRIYIIK